MSYFWFKKLFGEFRSVVERADHMTASLNAQFTGSLAHTHSMSRKPSNKALKGRVLEPWCPHWIPSGPREPCRCRKSKIAARHFLPLNCLQTPLTPWQHTEIVWSHFCRGDNSGDIPRDKFDTRSCVSETIARRQFSLRDI